MTQFQLIKIFRYSVALYLRMASTVPCSTLCSERIIFVANRSCLDKSFLWSFLTLSSIDPAMMTWLNLWQQDLRKFDSPADDFVTWLTWVIRKAISAIAHHQLQDLIFIVLAYDGILVKADLHMQLKEFSSNHLHKLMNMINSCDQQQAAAIRKVWKNRLAIASWAGSVTLDSRI